MAGSAQTKPTSARKRHLASSGPTEKEREYLEVMRRLWCDEISEYHGELYDLQPCRQEPKPVQRPHPPIHFGGESDAALERVADIGQGWYGFNLDPAELAGRLAHLETLLKERGRSRDEIYVSVCPQRRPASRELADAYRAAGADQMILLMGGRDADDVVARMTLLAKETVGS